MIDRDELARQTGGDAALQRELLDLFLLQIRDLACRLDAHVSGAEGAAVIPDLLHRVRGAAGAVGATELAHQFTRIEVALRTDRASPAVLARLRATLDSARESLAALILTWEGGALAKEGESR